MHLKKTALPLCLGMACIIAISPASAATSDEIRGEISEYKSELSESEEESESLNSQISEMQEEIGELYSEIESLNIQKQEYIESMSERIEYFYVNESGTSALKTLLSAESFADFLNAFEQTNELHNYDDEQLEEYEAIVDEIEGKQEEMDAQVDELCALLDEQEELQEELKEKISEKEDELEEAKKAEASTSSSSSSSFTYAMSSSGGVLTKQKGVVYYNGHRETYYSQRVLPGTGLNIPGRHVDPTDGTIRDGDGYICVASSDLAKGTIVETSLGTGKVYDCGCASGTIDIYTDW